MKNFFVFIALVCFIFPTTLMAFEEGSVLQENLSSELLSNDTQDWDKQGERVRDYIEATGNYMPEDQAIERGPAPPLSYLKAIAAISTNYPQYEIFTSEYTSTYDHGGAELYIVTRELGYGFSPVAKMNGQILSEFQSEPILNGTTVVGYLRWWDASGHQSGQFTYKNTSTNYPYNTMSDWINIK